MSIGQEIRRIRMAIGDSMGRYISQERLGGMVGLTRQTVFNYETEKTTPPSYFLETLQHILEKNNLRK